MVQNDKKTVTKPPEVNSQHRMMALLEKRFPERAGFLRRIKPVFDNYFRVNFQDTAQANIVAESHFVFVDNDKVTEMN